MHWQCRASDMSSFAHLPFKSTKLWWKLPFPFPCSPVALCPPIPLPEFAPLVSFHTSERVKSLITLHHRTRYSLTQPLFKLIPLWLSPFPEMAHSLVWFSCYLHCLISLLTAAPAGFTSHALLQGILLNSCPVRFSLLIPSLRALPLRVALYLRYPFLITLWECIFPPQSHLLPH